MLEGNLPRAVNDSNEKDGSMCYFYNKEKERLEFYRQEEVSNQIVGTC